MWFCEKVITNNKKDWQIWKWWGKSIVWNLTIELSNLRFLLVKDQSTDLFRCIFLFLTTQTQHIWHPPVRLPWLCPMVIWIFGKFCTWHKWVYLSYRAYFWASEFPNDTPNARNRNGIKKANRVLFSMWQALYKATEWANHSAIEVINFPPCTPLVYNNNKLSLLKKLSYCEC